MLWITSIAGAVGIQPMAIKINAKPGEKVPFTIKLVSTTKNPETIKFALTQPVQRIDGGFEFKPVNPDTFPDIQWVVFNTPSITVQPGGEAQVNGVVKVPANARGFHMVTIMAEQPPAGKVGALLLKAVYAIKLEINIDAPTPRTTAQVTDLEMIKGSNGEPRLQFKMKNSCLSQYTMNAYVAVRNSLTKKLIENVELRPGVYWRNKYDPVALPGATLLFFGTPKEVLLPGQYDLHLFFRYGTSGQTIISKTVVVKAGEYTYAAAKLRIMRIDPGEVGFSGKPGATSTKGIKFENRSDKMVKVVLNPTDISPDYPYSILDNTNIIFQNGREFAIEPGRMAVAVVSVKFPENAPAQGSYGLLNVTTLAADENPNPIEESTINLEAVIPGKYDFRAEATGISAARDGEKLLLSVVIKNNSNIKIRPQAVLYLKNSKGKILTTFSLTPRIDNNAALPGKLMVLTGDVNEIPAPGMYKAEIKILVNNQEIGSSILDLQVE